MTAQKKGQAETGGSQAGTAGESGNAKRKPWIKKTPVEIILEQVDKQRDKVEGLRTKLKKEEDELKLMEEAAKFLQAK